MMNSLVFLEEIIKILSAIPFSFNTNDDRHTTLRCKEEIMIKQVCIIAVIEQRKFMALLNS